MELPPRLASVPAPLLARVLERAAACPATFTGDEIRVFAELVFYGHVLLVAEGELSRPRGRQRALKLRVDELILAPSGLALLEATAARV